MDINLRITQFSAYVHCEDAQRPRGGRVKKTFNLNRVKMLSYCIRTV